MWDGGDRKLLPVAPQHLSNSMRQVSLMCPTATLGIIEHIMPLRLFGLGGVLVKPLYNGANKLWPPYHGRALEVWEALRPHVYEDGEPEKWYTIKSSARWEYPGGRNGKRAYVVILPNDKPRLEITLTVDYRGVGEWEHTVSFPDDALLEAALTAYTQGWPPRLKRLLRQASRLGWPHYERIVWPQDYPGNTLLRFAYHRLADLIGVLNILPPDGLLAARVYSVRAGHRADIEVVKRAQSILVPL